jgi:hypothetical protein
VGVSTSMSQNGFSLDFGVLAHRPKCTYYEKCILNIFKMQNKYEKSSDCTSRYYVFTHKKLWEKVFVECIRKTKKMSHRKLRASLVAPLYDHQNVYTWPW